MAHFSSPTKGTFQIAFWTVATVFLTVGCYVISVVWRVSVQEQKQFGRSDLIPLSLTPPKYKQEPTPQSLGQAVSGLS